MLSSLKISKSMESPEIVENMKASDASVASCGDGLEQHSSSVKENESLGNNLLEDLDSYLEDINDRLTISRMVSDSVIKGMVSAVAQEAAEKIAMKELEVDRLKETLCFSHVSVDKTESSGSWIRPQEPRGTKYQLYSSVLEALVEYDRIKESLGNFRVVAKEQFKKLKKEINNMKGCSSIRKISSSSELAGLGSILQEEASERWVDPDKMLGSLKITLDNVCKQVDDIVYLSKVSLSEWQQEQEFQEEIEAMVFRNCIHSLQEEFEERLWDQNARFYGCESINFLEKIKEVSNLRQELNAINKSLFMSEVGQLTSHGSAEIGEEWNNSKSTDHFYRKVLSNHVSSSASLREGNGEHESKSIMPENLDPAQLKHMSKDELVNYFKTEMAKMKRNHELQVREMTEDYFCLKRGFFKEKGSSLPLKKDKDFDMLRKKIPGVISKLDDMLVENEKLPAFNEKVESLGSLKERFDALLSENRQLKDLLTDKKRKVKCLSSQVLDAAEKMSRHSLAESNLLKEIGNFKCAIEDAHMEASINEEVFKCVLRELMGQMKCDSEDSEIESAIMQAVCGIIFREAAHNAEATNKCEIKDMDVESITMQGLMGVIFREIIKDAEAKLSTWNTKYINENEFRVSLEIKALEKEKAIRLEIEEKERLQQEILLLEGAMEEKENLALEAAAALVKEKVQFELASQELNDLRDHAKTQQILISESSKESDAIKSKLAEAMEHIDLYKVDTSKLNQKVELAMKKLREIDEERRMLLFVTQEKQDTLLMFEAKEKEHREQMESITGLVHGLSKEVAAFECRVTEHMKKNSLRLENTSSQLSSLIHKANILRRTGLRYKQRLERRCSDLQKAETEVDLLGDEVDALLSLLEKIYIALDHYSPILQHYPGIIEILKLVKKELSGESTKLV